MVSEDYIFKFLKTRAILSGLNDRQIKFLRAQVIELTLNPGEYAIIENEVSNDIYFIVSGSCEVVKASPSGETFVIDELKEGEMFGEVAFIDDKPRSSTVRAKTLTMLLKLPASKLEGKDSWIDVDHFLRVSTFDKLSANIINESFSKIRKTNLKFIESLKAQINHAELQNDFGAFFVFVITFFSTYNLLLSLFSLKREVYSPVELIFFSVILLSTSIFFVHKRNIPLASIGLTLNNSLTSFLETIPIVFFCLLSAGAIYVYITGSWINFFERLYDASLNLIQPSAPAVLFYLFSWELITRGVILNSLRRFLDDASGIRSVLITAIFLIPVTLQEGLDIVIIKFYLDVFLGFVYLRQNSLVGVTLLHYLTVQLSHFYF